MHTRATYGVTVTNTNRTTYGIAHQHTYEQLIGLEVQDVGRDWYTLKARSLVRTTGTNADLVTLTIWYPLLVRNKNKNFW